jgi:hypothetical protein
MHLLLNSKITAGLNLLYPKSTNHVLVGRGNKSTTVHVSRSINREIRGSISARHKRKRATNSTTFSRNRFQQGRRRKGYARRSSRPEIEIAMGATTHEYSPVELEQTEAAQKE